jgi:hypothetical protein
MKDIGIYRMKDRLGRLRSNGFFIAIGFAVVVCICFALSGVRAARSVQKIRLEFRINPNEAPPASLMRLPGIGLARANAIIEYRKQFQENNKSNSAFQDCSDLQKVKGIGPATAGNMCEWLKFK